MFTDNAMFTDNVMCAARTHLWVLEHVRLVKNDEQEFHFLVENGGLCA